MVMQMLWYFVLNGGSGVGVGGCAGSDVAVIFIVVVVVVVNGGGGAAGSVFVVVLLLAMFLDQC